MNRPPRFSRAFFSFPAVPDFDSHIVMKNNKEEYIYDKKSCAGVERGGRQRGMVLVVGLILLLVITIIGIAAMRATTMQERMSANSQQQMQAFQSAEESIRLVMAELRAQTPPPDPLAPSILVTALNNAGKPPVAAQSRQAGTGSAITSNATVTFNQTTNLAGFSMGVDSGNYIAYEFIIDSSAQQPAGAVSRQQQGVARPGPRP